MLGNRIRDLRISKGLNQVELANALGVSKQSVSNWENNNIMPSVEVLLKFSEYFSVSTDYILGIDKRETIDVSGISKEHIAHLRQLANDLKNKPQ